MAEMIDFKAGQLKELSDAHRLMVQLEVTGKLTRGEIAARCGFCVEYVNKLLREDVLVLEYRARLREEIEGAAKSVRIAAETEIQQATLEFVKTLVDIARDGENENARVSAARYGLQFAGVKLEDPSKNEIRTPHLAIRDGKKEEEEKERKTG
jgi:hypothetical protein